MADDRTYIRIHDGMPDHPKIDPLSDAAFRLLVSCWCWSSRHLTDGRMPVVTWNKRGTPKTRRELEAAGLVEPLDEQTVEFHDYLLHQRSAAEVAAMKEKRAAAGRAGGLAKAAASKSLASASPVAKQTASKTVASTETEPTTDVVGTRKRATAVPDEFEITEPMRAWGREHCPLVTDPAAETRQFLDHHRAKGSTMKDWPAAWRTWMGNAQKYAGQRGNVRSLPARQAPTGTDPHMAHMWEQR